MGNWRTVQVDGTCDDAEVPALARALEYSGTDFDNFHCLAYDRDHPSLCGLQGWAAPRIHAVGNLAERGYSVDDIEKQLRKIVATVPSLRLKVHCGGEYESKDCIATITVADGQVTRSDPEVKALAEVSTEQIHANLFAALMGGRRV